MQWNWKGMIFGLLAAVLCFVAVGMLSEAIHNAKTDEDDSQVVDTEEGGLYTPTPLAEDKVYYADIQVEHYGTIIVKLDQRAAPITAANFVALARDGFYDGLTFHRIISGFMMQGGDPTGTGTGGSKHQIYGEFAENGYDNPISHTRGVISMARAEDYDSADSQFFIVHQDYPSLDGKYAAFGEVVRGMNIVDMIIEDAHPVNNDGMIRTSEQPVITSITIREE